MPQTIAVAGKGGTGKSTIAALIILSLLEKKEKPVLAIDADPDSNLGTLLGVKVTQSIGDLREDALKKIKDLPAGMSKANYFEAGLHQIIEEVDGFDLITMGKGEGSGCYCYLNSLIRKFSEDLFPSYSWVVMDNEAGLEHISRRTTSNIDSLIVVVNANPISFNTAKTIANLSENLENKINKTYIVTNIVKEDLKKEVQKRISEFKMEYLGDIPTDAKLEEMIFKRGSLRELKESPAKKAIEEILEKIKNC
jgi:CO dehydrogenase maturation factor